MKKVEITAVLAFVIFVAAQSALANIPHALAQTDNLQVEVETSPIILDETATNTTSTDTSADTEKVGGIRGFFQRLFGGNDDSQNDADATIDDDGVFNVQVSSGDTLWGIVSDYVSAQSDLSGASNAGYTAAVINEMRKQNLPALGLSSDNVDLIYPGEQICFAIDIQADQTVSISESSSCS